MIKPNFHTICANSDYAKIFAEKGYAYFTNGAYNLNIIGIRSDNKNKVTNLFDDYLVVIYKTPNGRWTRQCYRDCRWLPLPNVILLQQNLDIITW